ncbi:hypothetical protein [Leuconostoc gelidum]|uniref:hypothetical protein n=1 Tax=Leuconostoc gelidum TaxID=1244 RepID=UPI001CC7219A|nr:hypothetical protein [Leuconostoc gelidum]MBZ6000920.1 hypothetical protein [Leuconostoc gelidum subsp. gelidum]
MAYDERIAGVIRDKIKNGETDFSLPEFNQHDVTDTAKKLANEFDSPEIYTDYSNNVVISFPHVKH